MAHNQTRQLHPKADWNQFGVDAVNQAIKGKLNALADLTFRANQTTTVLTNERVGVDSYINLMPTTANARTALNTSYVSARTNGTATFTHASASASDAVFVALIIG